MLTYRYRKRCRWRNKKVRNRRCQKIAYRRPLFHIFEPVDNLLVVVFGFALQQAKMLSLVEQKIPNDKHCICKDYCSIDFDPDPPYFNNFARSLEIM